MLYQSPSGVRLPQELDLVSGFVRGVFGHKFLARFYEFQRIQCCSHKKRTTKQRWQVMYCFVFGTLGPTSRKPFPLPFSPSTLLRHGRWQGQHLLHRHSRHVRTITYAFRVACRTNDCPRVRRVLRKRSSIHSPAKVSTYPQICCWNIRADYRRGAAEWYDVKGPSFFEVKNIGKTLVNRSQGLSMCSRLSQLDCDVLTISAQKMQTTRSRVGLSRSRSLTLLRTKTTAFARSSCASMKSRGRTA